MPNWLRHWRDWALADWWFPLRRGQEPEAQRSQVPQQQSFHFGYELDGQTIRHEPIPWCADQAFVEVLLRFPPGLVRRKSDFRLCLEGCAPIAPSSLRPAEEGQDWLRFPLPMPRAPSLVELRFRRKRLGQAALPFLSESHFLDHLHLHWPTVSVHLGAHTQACQAFIGTQGKGMIMGGLLTSPTCLLPLRRLEMWVELIEPQAAEPQALPVRLPPSHWLHHEAMVQVASLSRVRRVGLGQVRFRVGDHILANKEFQVLSPSALKAAVQLLDHQYIVRDGEQHVKLLRQPPLEEAGWVGVCFLLGSSLPGLAATVPITVRLVAAKNRSSKELAVQPDFLVSDGPTPFFSPLVQWADLQEIEAFEILCRGRRLGRVPVRPLPRAKFTSEGGFQMAGEELAWTATAEEELQARLKKLGTKIPW